MTTIIRIFFVAVLLFVCTTYSQAQQKTDTLKSYKRPFYGKAELKDSVTAAKIAAIQRSYRAGLLEVVATHNISEEIKKERVKTLIENRDRRIDSLYKSESHKNIKSSTKSL